MCRRRCLRSRSFEGFPVAGCREPAAGHERRLVHGPRRRKRADLHPRQRHVGEVLLRRDHRARRGAVRLRQRRRSRRLSRAGADARRQRRARRPTAPPGGRLFRNDLTVNPDGTRTLRFTDVTEASGITRARLRHGRGDRRFQQRRLRRSVPHEPRTEPVVPQQLRRHVHRRVEAEPAPTIRRGACRPRSSTTIATAGSICSSATTSTGASRSNTPCFSASGRPDYCSPNVFQPQPSRLYHNNRDGTFTDVTAASGIAREFGPALGVSTADFNGDGWIDLYVANDGQPNQLWINQHDGTFRNTGLLSGHGAERARESRRPAWASTPATSTTTATKTCSSRT